MQQGCSTGCETKAHLQNLVNQQCQLQRCLRHLCCHGGAIARGRSLDAAEGRWKVLCRLDAMPAVELQALIISIQQVCHVQQPQLLLSNGTCFAALPVQLAVRLTLQQ